MFGKVRSTSRSLVWPSAAELGAAAVLTAFSVLLVVQLAQSLAWPLTHDAAVVQFLAYAQVEWGLTPYLDWFDTVLPVSLLIQVGAGRLLGFGDAAFRLMDVTWLLALLGVTWQVLRPLGRAVAWAGPLLFGLIYLSYGPSLSFQRDYTGLLPIALSLWLAGRPATSGRRLAGRMALIGVLFGISIGIKPQLALGAPVVFWLALASGDAAMTGWRPSSWRFAIEQGVVLVLFMAGTVAAVVGWLVAQGAWPAFLSYVTQMMPLYNEMNGQFKTLAATDRLIYLFTSFQTLGGRAILLAPALLSGYLALRELDLRTSQYRLVVVLLILTGVYALYPVPAGKFWTYHWLPFFYFGSLSAALVLLPLSKASARPALSSLALGVWVLTAILVLRPAPDFYRQLMGDAPRAPRDGQVDEMAAYLHQNLRDGETVQPLDFVTGGALRAMMLADARPATPYIHISLLNHHISSPYIQDLRADLMARLEQAPPRFIIDIPDRARPVGPDTDETIPELARFITARYEIAKAGDGYVIYEHTK